MPQMPGISDAAATTLIPRPDEGPELGDAVEGSGQLRGPEERIAELERIRERLRQAVRQLRAEGEQALRERDEARDYARSEHARAERLAAELARATERAAEQSRGQREESENALARLRAEHEQQLAALRQEHEAQQQTSEAALSDATRTVRDLRLDLGREKQLAYQRAVEVLREEHLKEIAKSHQNGKNKGVAVTMAYLEAAKEEGADLGRTSELASAVLTRSAARFDSDFLGDTPGTHAPDPEQDADETGDEDEGRAEGTRRSLFALPRVK